MKSTGIVRHVDILDRIVIPKELRKVLNIKAKDLLEISVDQSNRIVLSTCESNDKSIEVGLTRRLDDLGRLVIPKEICKTLGITHNDTLQIFVDSSNIVLSKYEPACVFCREVSNTISYKDKLICKQCIEELKFLV